MSSKLYTHLGPYAVCKVGAIVATVQRPCCPVCTSETPGDWKFCQGCGSVIVDLPVQTTTPAVDPWAVREGIKEALHHVLSDEVDQTSGLALVFWLPNRLIKGRRHFDCGGDNWTTEVSPELINQEIDQFSIDYMSSLYSIREAYGYTHVRVCWGLVQYYS